MIDSASDAAWLLSTPVEPVVGSSVGVGADPAASTVARGPSWFQADLTRDMPPVRADTNAGQTGDIDTLAAHVLEPISA